VLDLVIQKQQHMTRNSVSSKVAPDFISGLGRNPAIFSNAAPARFGHHVGNPM